MDKDFKLDRTPVVFVPEQISVSREMVIDCPYVLDMIFREYPNSDIIITKPISK